MIAAPDTPGNIEDREMRTQEQLVIDLTLCDDDMIKRQALAEVACGNFSNFDHAYESLWDAFETELHFYAAVAAA